MYPNSVPQIIKWNSEHRQQYWVKQWPNFKIDPRLAGDPLGGTPLAPPGDKTCSWTSLILNVLDRLTWPAKWNQELSSPLLAGTLYNVLVLSVYPNSESHRTRNIWGACTFYAQIKDMVQLKTDIIDWASVSCFDLCMQLLLNLELPIKWADMTRKQHFELISRCSISADIVR